MRLSGPIALALLAAGPAAGAPKHDTNAPIDLDALSSTVQDKIGQATFTGDVRAHQGDLDLNADSVKVFYKRKGDQPEIQRLDAQGHVHLRQPDQTATGNYGIYDVVNRTLTMIGDVVLTQKQSVVRGQRLLVDLDSGRSTLDGKRQGGGDAGGGASANSGRVTGRFVVPPRKADTAGSAPK